MQTAAPWLVFVAYCAVTWLAIPRMVNASQFFAGTDRKGAEPGIILVALSAAVTWVFAKSIANAADLGFAYGSRVLWAIRSIISASPSPG